MIILSCHNVRVPFISAHSIYTVQTSIDLARLGETFFYANKGDERVSFKSLYGIDPTCLPSFHLRITRLPHKGLAGVEKRMMVLRDVRRFKGSSQVISYVTQVRPLRYLLFLKGLGFKIKIVLEVHSEREPWDSNLLKRVDGIIFTSKTLQDRLTERFSIPLEIPQRVFYHRVRKPLVREVPQPRSNKDSYCLGYI